MTWRILEPIKVGLGGVQIAVWESVDINVSGQNYNCITPAMHTIEEIRFYKKECLAAFDRAEALLERTKAEPPKSLFDN
jgi:hypothetical protein